MTTTYADGIRSKTFAKLTNGALGARIVAAPRTWVVALPGAKATLTRRDGTQQAGTLESLVSCDVAEDGTMTVLAYWVHGAPGSASGVCGSCGERGFARIGGACAHCV